MAERGSPAGIEDCCSQIGFRRTRRVADGIDAWKLRMQVSAGDPASDRRPTHAGLIDTDATELPPRHGGHANFGVCVTTGVTDSPWFGHGLRVP